MSSTCFFQYLLSMFLIIAFINAFNLIDGIDGMSSVTGIVISACFGFLFYKLQLFFFMFISVCSNKHAVGLFTL